jgi:hypothetical protein
MTEAAGDGSARAPGEIGFGRAKSVFLEHLQHRRAVRQEPRRNRSMSGLMPEFRSRMSNSSERRTGLTWLWLFPPARWLPGYRSSWVRGDVVAGVTLAAYAIPVSLLCRTCGPAAPGRCIRLSAGRARLRLARVVPSTGDRAHLRHLAHDRRDGGSDGGGGRATL